MKIRTLLAVAIGCTYGCASAEGITATTLNSWITSDDGALHLAATAFIAGVIDENTVAHQLTKIQSAVDRRDSAQGSMCVPSGVGSSRLRALVQNFLAQHREYQGMPAVVLVRKAIGEAYPCSDNQTPARSYYECRDLAEITYFAASANLSRDDRKSLSEREANAAVANKVRDAIPAKSIKWYELTGAGSHGNAGDGLTSANAAREDGILTALYQFGDCLAHGVKSLP